MKLLLSTAVIFFVITGSITAKTVSTVTYIGNSSQGQTKSVSCAGCHGVKGNSLSGEFPKLAGQHASYLASALRNYRDGSRVNVVMQGMATALTDEDIADLAAYYSEQAVSAGVVDRELLLRGEALYRFGDESKGISACQACHGPTGQGIASAVFPSLKGQWASYAGNSLMAFREGKRVNTMMNGVAKNMSDEDIKAVSSYVEGLR